MTVSSSSKYLYLHGFASGPKSKKLLYLQERFLERGLSLQCLDLNQGDFFNLTLSRQIEQCEAVLNPSGTWTVIGSSLGGLTAAWLGQRNPQVRRLVLLAPAFDFLAHWQLQLGTETLQNWCTSGSLEVYHHMAQQPLPLSYRFWQDASQYSETALTRPVPTLILHGTDDEVIPVKASRAFVADRDWCQLIELESDHALGNVLPQLWDKIFRFISESCDSARHKLS